MIPRSLVASSDVVIVCRFWAQSRNPILPASPMSWPACPPMMRSKIRRLKELHAGASFLNQCLSLSPTLAARRKGEKEEKKNKKTGRVHITGQSGSSRMLAVLTANALPSRRQASSGVGYTAQSVQFQLVGSAQARHSGDHRLTSAVSTWQPSRACMST